MTPVEDHCTVFLDVATQLLHQTEVASRRQDVEHVNRDAEGGARGDGGRQHGDRPTDERILVAFGHSLGAAFGFAVVIG
jgi:hypothetical protein